MPTAYTAPIAEGITFEQYALGCAKAFGACITMRDEDSSTPIPDNFPVAEYYYTAVTEADKALEDFKALDAEQVEKKYEEYFKKSWEDYEATKIRYAELESKYLAMLSQVLLYKSPSSDHDNYKQFMIEQIRQSIDHDCSMTYYDEPKRVDFIDWWQEQLEYFVRAANNRSKSLHEEIERVEKRNLWIKLLKESLK